MEVVFSKTFKRAYKKRITNEIDNDLFKLKLGIFIENPFEESLKTHKLSGKLKNLYSFSIHYDLRVIFVFTKDKPKNAVFLDIGNHNEVY